MVDSYIHLSFYWILQSWDRKHPHYANWLRKFSKKPKSGCDDSLTEMTNLENWNKNNPIIARKCHNMSICPHDTKLVLPSCPTIPDIILNVRQCCCFTILGGRDWPEKIYFIFFSYSHESKKFIASPERGWLLIFNQYL